MSKFRDAVLDVLNTRYALGEMAHQADAIDRLHNDEVAKWREALDNFVKAEQMPTWVDATFNWPLCTTDGHGTGECAKHGRFYGICHSCRKDAKRQQDAANGEARSKRNAALSAAGNTARSLLGGVL
jgi:hypothetical protein